MRAAALLAALALALAPAAPAAASGLPPLGLERGHGSVGLGAFHVAGDVAIVDDVTIGADAYFFLYWNAATARASWTGWKGPLGALGLLAAGGMGVGYSGASTPFLQLGPVYETPPAPVRLRVALGTGVWQYNSTTYASGWTTSPSTGIRANYPDDPAVSIGTRLDFGLQPVIEVVIPVGPNFEVTLLGNSLAGLYGRW